VFSKTLEIIAVIIAPLIASRLQSIVIDYEYIYRANDSGSQGYFTKKVLTLQLNEGKIAL
jgi:hypothetical protein